MSYTDTPAAADRRARARARADWSLDNTLGAMERFSRSTIGHVLDGQGSVEELRRLAELRDELTGAVDALATKLLGWELSNAEVGEALGITKQAVAKRYPGASSRKSGGQTAELR